LQGIGLKKYSGILIEAGMYKLFLGIFFIISLLILNVALAEELSPNIIRRVNAVTLELDKAEEALNRKHSAAFQDYMKGAEKEYDIIYEYYPGKADPNHPVLSELENRINELYARNGETYQVRTTRVNPSSSDQINTKSPVNPEGLRDVQEVVIPDYQYSEIYDGMTEKTLHSFKSNKETIIKSGVDKLSYASGTDILVAFQVDEQKKTIHSIELQLSIVRAQLYSATKGSQVLTMSPKELIMLKPIIPLTVILKGTNQLIEIIQQKYDEDKSLEQAIAALDSSGFPAILNIENYELVRYFQMDTAP
jgi:hypothetical protein